MKRLILLITVLAFWGCDEYAPTHHTHDTEHSHDTQDSIIGSWSENYNSWKNFNLTKKKFLMVSTEPDEKGDGLVNSILELNNLN